MPETDVLVLFGPSLGFLAMVTEFGFCAELAYDDWLLWQNPKQVVGRFRRTNSDARASEDSVVKTALL
jgi:hypothetical protein